MRVIKFRFVYRGDNGIHFKRYYLNIFIDRSLSQISDIHHQMILIDKNQYTGLKDKNGKEIYEGDILETSCNGIDPYDNSKCDKWKHLVSNQPVRWNEEYLTYMGIGDTREHNSIYNPRFYEIIGNIYENPELLK